MAIVVDQVAFPATRGAALTFRVYEDATGFPANVAVSLAAAGTSATESVYANKAFVAPYSGTVTGTGTVADKLLFSVTQAGGWPPTVTHVAVLRVTSDTVPSTRQPLSIAVGKQVHYYPRAGEADGIRPAGGLATITSVSAWPTLTVTYGGQSLVANMAGTSGTRRGGPGTWEPLDFRHRRHLRLHLSHAAILADTLVANPGYLATYFPSTEFDLIIQDPVTQQALFTSTIAKFNSVGAVCNFGFIRLAPRRSDATDGPAVPNTDKFGVLVPGSDPAEYVVGMTSTWLNRTWWQECADIFYEAWNANKANLGDWYHSQKECANISQGLQRNLDVVGATRTDLKYAMQPYLDAITSSGLYAIVRPFAILEDTAFGLILDAAREGSVYCTEVDNSQSRRFRHGEAIWQQTMGNNRETWEAIRTYVPRTAIPVPLKLEAEFRSWGKPAYEARAEEYAGEAVHEIVDLVEVIPGFVPDFANLPRWYQAAGRANSLSGGNKRASANDVLFASRIAPDTIETYVKRCVGSKRIDISPWKRSVNPNIDAIDTLRPVGALGWTCLSSAANVAECWRPDSLMWLDPDTGALLTSFTVCLPVILPTLPGPGVIYGVGGCMQANGSSHSLVLNGDAGGALELRVVKSGGFDTFTIDAAPTPGVVRRLLWGYDNTTGKWLADTLGMVTPTTTRIPSSIALLFGGTHDIMNRSTVVWGCPGLVLPYDETIIGWRRMLTAEEITCARDPANTVPYGYNFY